VLDPSCVPVRQGGRHRVGECLDQRGDRQPRQIDFFRPHHLEQPVERPGEAVDRQHRRCVASHAARRILPGGDRRRSRGGGGVGRAVRGVRHAAS